MSEIPDDVKALIERLRLWGEKPHEGDPIIDAMSDDLAEAADALASQAALIAKAREQALEAGYAKGVMKGIALGLEAGVLTAEKWTQSSWQDEVFATRSIADNIRALIPAEAAKEDRG